MARSLIIRIARTPEQENLSLRTSLPVTSLLPGQVSQMWVQFLPDGKHFMYLARTTLTSADPGAKVYVQSLDGGAPTILLASQSRALAVPEYLLFAQDQNLFAQRMDWEALRQIGKPSLVTRNVAASPAYLGTSEFTASQNGVLITGQRRAHLSISSTGMHATAP